MTESNRLSDLVSWLRTSAAGSLDPNVGEAADTIEALEKRIEELEAALKPFADEAQFFVSKALDNHLAAPDRLYLTIGDFRAARKVLGDK